MPREAWHLPLHSEISAVPDITLFFLSLLSLCQGVLQAAGALLGAVLPDTVL